MKLLLTILFITIGNVKAQTTYDTTATMITVMDGTYYWEYRHKDGKLLYRIKGYEPELTPKGGYMIKDYIKPALIAINGFIVNKNTTTKTITTNVTSTEIIAFWGRDKKPIDKKYLIMWPYNTPVDGYK